MVTLFRLSSQYTQCFCITTFSLGIFVDFYFALIPALLMFVFFFNANVCWPFISKLSIKYQNWPELHLGSFILKLERVSQIRKHPQHRRWVSHVACEAWRSSGCLIFWRKKQQNRGQGNTNREIGVVPRSTSASSFGEAVGDHHYGSKQHSMEK